MLEQISIRRLKFDTTKKWWRSLFERRKEVTVEEMRYLIEIHYYDRLMICSGQYDDKEERAENESWEVKINKLRDEVRPLLKYLPDTSTRDLPEYFVIEAKAVLDT